jgi:4-diphosphocytidyl-2-C-methyl-D-erythritol kinase
LTALRDIGRAKINLTLDVLGRRPDGFHELKSLVAFANFGDELELLPAEGLALDVAGPFAASIGDCNLILEASYAAREKVPGLKLGRFRLNKNLPVAAGLGGGSADAAAALRLIARANDGLMPQALLAELSAKLGSDVSVCLKSRPALITGRGEKVELVTGFPACGVILANPGEALATQAVYAALHAGPAAALPSRHGEILDFRRDLSTLLAYALPRGNALEVPAVSLAPRIKDLFTALEALEDVRLARLSGSGPTCFALVATEDDAKRGASRLAAKHPNWWIASGALEA